MKKLLFFISVIFSITTVGQSNENIFGSFESNSQLLQDDNSLNFTSPEDNFRANNYFQLNYNIGNVSTGIQYESYLPSAMLGYYPQYNGENGIASYFVNIKRNKTDITFGYFYGQFGNGLIFRSWENRQLGINNAIKGIKLKYKFSESFNLTTIYGQQRNGFELNEATIQGVDTNLNLNKFLNLDKTDLTIGASYIGRYQNNSTNDLIPANVKSLGARVDLYSGRFSLNFEGIIKDSDVIANEGIILSDKLYDGTALQLDLGYSKKGLGLNTTFRRLENFNFYSIIRNEKDIYVKLYKNLVNLDDIKDGKYYEWRVGVWMFWYPNGKMKFEGLYKDGTLISKKCWNIDGVVIGCDLLEMTDSERYRIFKEK